jgi:hypothetical protein
MSSFGDAMTILFKAENLCLLAYEGRAAGDDLLSADVLIVNRPETVESESVLITLSSVSLGGTEVKPGRALTSHRSIPSHSNLGCPRNGRQPLM